MRLCYFLCALMISSIASAQDGYSSASVSMNRANGILTSDQVVVEEYINYHKHDIPLPKSNQDVNLSLSYKRFSDKSLLLQAGIATQRIQDYSQMSPINISLVIDISGSMESDNKLKKVKKSLKEFAKGLRDDDYISIVVYSTEARVAFHPQKVGDRYTLDKVIESLETEGSTNLYDGMVLGYEQVKRNYNSSFTNKVIVLTDGIANMGITDEEEIIAKSFSYNQEGIDISTIGVGSDINYTLLQKIAKAGRGANHFVGGSEEDINKVFVDELESLLSPVARAVYLEIFFPENLKVNKVFGYSPEYTKNSIKIPLKNINNGLTQVILLEFNKTDDNSIGAIETSLSYFSYAKGENVTLKERLKIKDNKELKDSDNDITKNLCIANMAYSLKEMAKAVEDKNFGEAQEVLQAAVRKIEKQFPASQDKDILRIKNIMLENKSKLAQYVARLKY